MLRQQMSPFPEQAAEEVPAGARGSQICKVRWDGEQQATGMGEELTAEGDTSYSSIYQDIDYRAQTHRSSANYLSDVSSVNTKQSFRYVFKHPHSYCERHLYMQLGLPFLCTAEPR